MYKLLSKISYKLCYYKLIKLGDHEDSPLFRLHEELFHTNDKQATIICLNTLIGNE